MIKKLYIKKLFGLEGNDKDIEFNDSLSILVGKNGSGKTTVLNILNAIITKSFNLLLDIDFDYIRFESDDGIILITNKQNAIFIRRIDIESVLTFHKIRLSRKAVQKIKQIMVNDDVNIYTNFKDENIYDDFQELISKIYVEVPKNGNGVSPETKRSFEKFFFKSSSLYFPTYRRIEADLLELILTTFKSSVHMPQYMIEERLAGLINEQGRKIIGLSNKDISTIVAKKWNEISETEKLRLKSLVENFFLTFLESDVDESPVVIVESIELQKDLEEAFRRTGLIGKSEKKWIQRIMEYVNTVDWSRKYINDFTKTNMGMDSMQQLSKAMKVSYSYEKIYKMIQIYRKTCLELDFIKEPFRNLNENLSEFIEKKVIIKDGELLFVQGGHYLHFENLSAGEKQLVAMFVYSRLALENGSIVLIDEPELSLHINWQRKFLKALTSGGQPMQYIISTHSPFIVSNYRNNTIPLGPTGDN